VPELARQGTARLALLLAPLLAVVCALALAATMRATSRRGRREIPAAEFFRGIYTTALQPGEVLTTVVVPPLAAGWRSGFDELARRHGDYALVAVAAHVRVAEGTVAEARLAFAGVGPTPVRATSAERALAGSRIDERLLGEVARLVAEDLDPPSDVHASAALRRHLAGVLTRRVVSRLLG